VHIHNAPPDTKVEQSSDGSRVDVWLGEQMAQQTRPGTPFAKALKQNFGLTQATTRR
jgi:hypothetical protein